MNLIKIKYINRLNFLNIVFKVYLNFDKIKHSKLNRILPFNFKFYKK